MCHRKCYRVTHINISAKSSQNLTKLSAYVWFGLLSWLIMFVRMHVHACTHSMWKHARYFYDFFAFFVCFLSVFGHFEAFPYWKWKNGEHTPERYRRGATFVLFIFSISVRMSSKVAEMCLKMVKIPLFYPWWPKYATWNKNHKIKKFPHILWDKMQLFSFINFFFSVRKSSKMAKTGPKMVKIPLFLPWVAKICNLGMKVTK